MPKAKVLPVKTEAAPATQAEFSPQAKPSPNWRNELARWQLPALVALPALAAVLLYWPTLSLPVLYDDLLHIRITGGLNWLSVWLPTGAFGFYRPFTFAPLLAIKSIFGYYPAGLLHGVNVVQHAVNATLLTALVWRLWRKPFRALTSGLLFSVFPFSYQAVAVYGHNVHPAIVGGLLLGLHSTLSALRAQPGRARAWWALTGVIFFINLLTHESAVLFGVLALLLSWASTTSGEIESADLIHWLRRPSLAWLIFTLLGAAYVVIYRFLPISRTAQAATGETGGLITRGLYFLQAAAYPFTWFAHRLRALPADQLILFSLALTLVLIAWAGRRRANWLPLLFGAGWWALASTLLAASLPTDYLLHGPRLLYLGSVGLALVWAILIEALFALPRIGLPAGGLFLAFVLLTNARFVSDRLADYHRLTEPVRVLQAERQARPPNSGLLLINLPQWYSTPQPTYAFGAEFVSLLGDYLFAEELIDANLGGAHLTRAVALPELRTATEYAVGLHAQHRLEALEWGAEGRDWQVFITRYLPDGPRTTYLGGVSRAGAPSPPLATFGSYELLAAAATACNSTAEVTLDWRSAATPADRSPFSAAFVHVIDGQSQLLGQLDGAPLGLPPQSLPAGAGYVIHDVRRIPLSEGQPAQVRLGFYDYNTLQRFPAFDGRGRPLADDTFYLPVSVCR